MENQQHYPQTKSTARSQRMIPSAADSFQLLQFCFFLSGISALIYEISWLSRIQVLVGATVLGLALTLSAYLMGLAVGSAAGAIFAPRTKHPLRWYLICESVVGCAGLLFAPLVVRLQGQSPLWALLSVFIPTVFLGATLPLLLEWVNAKSRLSSLYSANAAGAAVGSLLCALFILPLLGFSSTMIFAATINAVVVVIGSQLKSFNDTDLLSRVRGAAQQRNHEKDNAQMMPPQLCMVALFMTGALSFCTQLIWNRLGALMIGPTAYVFPLVACIVLSGIALGSRFLTQLQKRSITTISLFLAGGLLWSFALLSHGSIAMFWFHGFWPARSSAAPFAIKFIFELFLFAVACGPAAIVAGGLFPYLALQLSGGRHDKSASRSTGIAGALSVSGGLVGSLMFTLLILPRWGVGSAGLVLYVVAVVPAFIKTFSELLKGGTKIQFKLQNVAPLLLSCFLVLALPQTIFPFDQRLLTSGTFYNRHGHLGQPGIGYTSSISYLRDKAEDILAAEDDATALVSVHENVLTGHRFFKINGKVDGGTGEDVTTTQLVAEIPFLLRDPLHPFKQVLTIGLGTGNTQSHVLKFDEVQQATVVELSSAVSKFAKQHFSKFNDGFSQNPKSSLIEDDGRRFLARAAKQQPGQYDLIISEPSNPWVAGQSSLFTVEYYQLIAQSLAPHGLASLWFHSYGLGCESVTSILKAISQVFPRYLVFQEGGDYFVVASPEKNDLQVHDANAISGLQKNWYGIFQTQSLDSFLTSRLFFDEQSLKPALRNAVANSDDNQFLQYDSGQTFHRDLQCVELENFRTPEPTKFNAKMSAWQKRWQ